MTNLNSSALNNLTANPAWQDQFGSRPSRPHPLARRLAAWRNALTQRFPRLRRLFPADTSSSLPPIPLTLGGVFPAWPIRVIAAALPLIMMLLIPVRLGSGFGLSLGLTIIGVALAILTMLLPTPAAAFAAIIFAALFGFGTPASLGWALALAALGYLALRFGVLCQRLPLNAVVSWKLLRKVWLRDALILGITALAGGIGVIGRRLTGCVAHGSSVADFSQTNVVVQTCHPAGSALVVIGGIALAALTLALTGYITATKWRNR